MRIIFVLPVTLFILSFTYVSAQQSATGTDTLARKQNSSDTTTFTHVDIESEYPGARTGWNKFLGTTLRYPNDAVDNMIQGTVVVQFIVDQEGNVSNIQAISGPTKGGLREEAMRCIEKSGKWIPASRDGRKVRSYKKQPVTFKLSVH